MHGVRAALHSVGFDSSEKKIVILGRGGGAKAAAAAVAGAREVVVLSRADIADSNIPDCDLLINATPVGMFPNVDASPVEGALRADVVFDMVYNPPVTRLLQNAMDQGKIIASGTTMLAAQAARQFEIWTGQRAPRRSLSRGLGRQECFMSLPRSISSPRQHGQPWRRI